MSNPRFFWRHPKKAVLRDYAEDVAFFEREAFAIYNASVALGYTGRDLIDAIEPELMRLSAALIEYEDAYARVQSRQDITQLADLPYARHLLQPLQQRWDVILPQLDPDYLRERLNDYLSAREDAIFDAQRQRPRPDLGFLSAKPPAP